MNRPNPVIWLITASFLWAMLLVCPSGALGSTLLHSVDQALKFSPKLKSLAHNHKAVEHELNKSYGRYLPSLDLTLGSGLEQHSDITTREADASPGNEDWYHRSEASVKFSQPLYDGGETRQYINIHKAILDSSQYQIKDMTQQVILDAVTAHLEIVRQRELLNLAKKDLEIHKNIFQALSDMEQAGAGNIADVAQTQTRMSRAESILFVTKGQVNKAIARYERIVGEPPGKLAYAELPKHMPASLPEAVITASLKNPELMALKAAVKEAEARIALSRTNYIPKINAELASRYHDRLEGDSSWQNTNDAMVVFRWNLYKGGQDLESTRAAAEKKNQSRANRRNRQIEIQEAVGESWSDFISLEKQKKIYKAAVNSSRQTFDAYLKQFGFSQRSLLDILNAEVEYFQSARQYVMASIAHTIAAYRILRISGTLQIEDLSQRPAEGESFAWLSQPIVLPFMTGETQSPPEAAAETASPMPPPPSPRTAEEPKPASGSGPEVQASGPAEPSLPNAFEIGPCATIEKLEQAKDLLKNYSVDTQYTRGRGPVQMFRLLQGEYPRKTARQELNRLKKTVDSAFVLPDNGNLKVYAGTFHDRDRALAFMERLEEDNIKVSLEESTMEAEGAIILVSRADRETASGIIRRVKALGLHNTEAKTNESGPDIRYELQPESTVNQESVADPDSVAAPDPLAAHEPNPETEAPLYSFRIGPCVTSEKLEQAKTVLKGYPVDIQLAKGTGPVKMFRLLEGTYPQAKAFEQLDKMKKNIDSAFALPDDGRLKVYAGTFHDQNRALRFMEELKRYNIKVSLEENTMEAEGTTIQVSRAGKETADSLVREMTELGLYCSDPAM